MAIMGDPSLKLNYYGVPVIVETKAQMEKIKSDVEDHEGFESMIYYYSPGYALVPNKPDDFDDNKTAYYYSIGNGYKQYTTESYKQSNTYQISDIDDKIKANSLVYYDGYKWRTIDNIKFITDDLKDKARSGVPADALAVEQILYSNQLDRMDRMKPRILSYWYYGEVVKEDTKVFSIGQMPRNSFVRCHREILNPSDYPPGLPLKTADNKSIEISIYIERIGMNPDGSISMCRIIDPYSQREFIGQLNGDDGSPQWFNDTDSTFTQPNQAANALALGQILYTNQLEKRSVMAPKVLSYWYYGQNGRGISDMPANSFTRFPASALKNEDRPIGIPNSEYIHVIKMGINPKGDIALCLVYAPQSGRFFISQYKPSDASVDPGLLPWKEISLAITEKQKIAQDLGLLKHIAYIDRSANGYYLTQLARAGLSEVNVGEWLLAYNINGSGAEQDGNFNFLATTKEYLPCSPNTTFYYGGSSRGRFSKDLNKPGYFYIYLHEYKEVINSDTGKKQYEHIGRKMFIDYVSGSTTDPNGPKEQYLTPITTSNLCTAVRFVFGYGANVGLPISQEDISNYFCIYKGE